MVFWYSSTVRRRRAYGPAESTTPSGPGLVVTVPPPLPPAAPPPRPPEVVSGGSDGPPDPGRLPCPISPVQAVAANNNASAGAFLNGVIVASPEVWDSPAADRAR